MNYIQRAYECAIGRRAEIIGKDGAVRYERIRRPWNIEPKDKKPPIKTRFLFYILGLFKIKAIEIRYNEVISIDIEKELIATLKKRQFVETVKDGWINGFTRVIITPRQVFIGHDVKGAKLTVVENPLLSLSDYIKYFQRI